jgi:aspartate carbamoyltransferase catalytic subunit
VELRLKELNCDFNYTENMNDVIEELDALYMTRLQKERFPDPTDYERFKGAYQIKAKDLENVKDHFVILHPLPRVFEIDYDIDKTKHSKYFEQAQNGVWVRMALILKFLGLE